MAKKEYKTYQAAILQARAHRNFRKQLADNLKPYSLTVMEWALLGLVSEHEDKGVSITDLAGMLSVKTALTSVMVSKQAKSGMVQKVSSPKDSRLKYVCLTDEGRAKVQQIEGNLNASLQAWFREIGANDLDSYMATAETLSQSSD